MPAAPARRLLLEPFLCAAEAAARVLFAARSHLLCGVDRHIIARVVSAGRDERGAGGERAGNALCGLSGNSPDGRRLSVLVLRTVADFGRPGDRNLRQYVG